jgi:hypothetical protein
MEKPEEAENLLPHRPVPPKAGTGLNRTPQEVRVTLASLPRPCPASEFSFLIGEQRGGGGGVGCGVGDVVVMGRVLRRGGNYDSGFSPVYLRFPGGEA